MYIQSKLILHLSFRLPLHNPVLREKWFKALKIGNWTPTKYFNVCSQRFREVNFRKSISQVPLSDLLHNVVPSLYQDNLKNEKCALNNKLVLSL